YGLLSSPMSSAMTSAMNTTAEAVVISAPAIASGWRRSASREDTGDSLLEALHEGNERVDFCSRKFAVLVRHRRLLRRLGLGRSLSGMGDPLPDLVGRELLANAVQWIGLVALACDGVADRALLSGVDSFPLLDRVVLPRSRQGRRNDSHGDGERGHG